MRVEGIVLAQDRKARGGRMEGRMEEKKKEEERTTNPTTRSLPPPPPLPLPPMTTDNWSLGMQRLSFQVGLGKVREGMPRGWKFARKV